MRAPQRIPILCYTCNKAMAYAHAEAVERAKKLAGLVLVPSSMALAQLVNLGQIQCPTCERANANPGRK